jgi:putative DNA primase/helicase
MLEQARAVNLNNNPPLCEKEIEQTIQSIFDMHHKEQNASPAREISIVSIHDFLAMDIPQREVVLSPWLPAQGLCMVYGYRGSGKTYILLGVAVAISSGGAFLRWRAVNPRRVVYIDGEMPAKVMQERLSSVIMSADKEPLPGHLQIITSDFQKNGLPDLSTPEGQSIMDSYFEKGDVVILDNISTLCRTGKENTGDDWGPVQSWGLSLRRKGISVIFVHHEGKNGLQRGTSKREDVLDTVIRLKRPGDYSPHEGLRVEIHYEKNRGIYGEDVKPFEVKLMADVEHLDWQIKDLEESLTERVAGLLNENIPQNELAEMLQISKGTVSKHKKRAHDQGLLKGSRS